MPWIYGPYISNKSKIDIEDLVMVDMKSFKF